MKRPLDLSRPIGGAWTYTQPETGVTLKEQHHKAFLTKIRNHRLANDLPLHGGWADEVWDTVCRENPSIPQETIGEVPRYYSMDDAQRFITTMRELNKSNELVTEEEQRRRIDICATCPKNGVIGSGGGCKFCAWMAQQITEVLGGRPIHRVAEVSKRSCMACGCSIIAKTAVPLDVLTQVDEKLGSTPDYDLGCWMGERDV